MNNDSALHYATEHSNRIEQEPVKGMSFDTHLRAALLTRTASDAGQLLHPRVLHQLLYEGLPSDPRHPVVPGEYRDVDVYIMQGLGKEYHFPPHKKVPALMSTFLNVLWSAQHYGSPWLGHDHVRWGFHAWFETIHPFQDGNGRVGRLLWWNLEMLMGKAITVIAFEERHDYYDGRDLWRRDYCNTGHENPFR